MAKNSLGRKANAASSSPPRKKKPEVEKPPEVVPPPVEPEPEIAAPPPEPVRVEKKKKTRYVRESKPKIVEAKVAAPAPQRTQTPAGKMMTQNLTPPHKEDPRQGPGFKTTRKP